jgi:hypothetical protein
MPVLGERVGDLLDVGADVGVRVVSTGRELWVCRLRRIRTPVQWRKARLTAESRQ